MRPLNTFDRSVPKNVVPVKHILILLVVTTLTQCVKLGWTSWTKCTAFCGGGIQIRRKYCKNPYNGEPYMCRKTQSTCNVFQCSDSYRDEAWTECDKQCGGGGLRHRWNAEGTHKQTIKCSSQSCEEIQGNCTVDIVFLLDSSGSITNLNWAIIKQFTIDMIKGLKVHKQHSRVSVIVFSPSTQVIVPLDSSNSEVDYEAKIWAAKHVTGGTNTAGGLQKMTEMIKAQGRPGVKSIGVVISDGISTIDADHSARKAEIARQSGTSLFVIAVGYSDLAKIKTISSKPYGTFLYDISDFNTLKDITDYIVNDTCTLTTSQRCGECSKPVCEEAGQFNKFTLPSWRECHSYDQLDNLINGTEVQLQCDPIQCHVIPDGNEHRTTIKPDKLCAMCNYTNGQGWVASPVCHEYYICVKQPRGIDIHKVSCGNLYWNQDYKTCVKTRARGTECQEEASTSPITTSTTTPAPTHVSGCYLSPYPGNDSKFWIPMRPNSLMTCPEKTVFSKTKCTCVKKVDQKPKKAAKCSLKPLLYFPFDHHTNDVTCRQAIGTKYGSGQLTYESSGSRKYVCFKGDAYIEVPFLRSYFAGQKVNRFSVSLWFKRSGYVEDHAGLVHNGDCFQRPGFQISLKRKNIFGSLSLQSSQEVFTSEHPVNDEWHFAVISYTGYRYRLYLDGKQVDKQYAKGFLMNTDSPLTIGRICGDCQFNGCIDELKLHSKFLTRRDISKLYKFSQ